MGQLLDKARAPPPEPPEADQPDPHILQNGNLNFIVLIGPASSGSTMITQVASNKFSPQDAVSMAYTPTIGAEFAQPKQHKVSMLLDMGRVNNGPRFNNNTDIHIARAAAVLFTVSLSGDDDPEQLSSVREEIRLFRQFLDRSSADRFPGAQATMLVGTKADLANAERRDAVVALAAELGLPYAECSAGDADSVHALIDNAVRRFEAMARSSRERQEAQRQRMAVLAGRRPGTEANGALGRFLASMPEHLLRKTVQFV